jgi:multimeric flavodoxin WrbA
VRIVGLVGSPRQGMNTDTLVREALRGAETEGAATEVVHLNRLDIRPCQACHKHPAPNHCFFFDDMQKIYEVLENADGIILGSPIYYGTVSAQVKHMIDRANCLTWIERGPDGKPVFTPRLEKIKKGAVILVSDITKDNSAAMLPIRLFFHDARVEKVGELFIPHADAGKGARNSEEWLELARALGASLAEAIRGSSAQSQTDHGGRHGETP